MNKTIEVYGSVKLEPRIAKYRVKIAIEGNPSPYGDEEVSDFEEIKNQYYLALVEAGIDIKKFEEDVFEFRAYNYQSEGTLLKYECVSKKEITQLLNIKISGIFINLLECNHIIDEELHNKLIKAALENAREKANRILEKINKKAGEIVKIEDNRILNDHWVAFSPYDEYFELKVVFEME